MNIVILALLVFFMVYVGAMKINAVDNKSFRLDGRYEISNGGIAFDHPGFSISFSVLGTKNVKIILSAVVVIPNRFWIYVNGSLHSEFIDTGGMDNYTATPLTVVTDLDEALAYDIKIIKITEAQYNELYPSPNFIVFTGIEVDDGASLLLASQLKEAHKIEFIGDSLTSGYCDLCHSIDSSLGMYTQQSYAIAYPYLTCQHFQAECHTAAWSGYGLVRNCCGGDTLMPEIYSRTLATVQGSVWNASSWLPDVVVINLGSNDGLDSLHPDGDLEQSFVQTYFDFVSKIYSVPSSEGVRRPTFFLACGPDSISYCRFVADVVQKLVIAQIPAYYLGLGTMQFTDACCHHPSQLKQAEMANITISHIAKVMNW